MHRCKYSSVLFECGLSFWYHVVPDSNGGCRFEDRASRLHHLGRDLRCLGDCLPVHVEGCAIPRLSSAYHFGRNSLGIKNESVVLYEKSVALFVLQELF